MFAGVTKLRYLLSMQNADSLGASQEIHHCRYQLSKKKKTCSTAAVAAPEQAIKAAESTFKLDSPLLELFINQKRPCVLNSFLLGVWSWPFSD